MKSIVIPLDVLRCGVLVIQGTFAEFEKVVADEGLEIDAGKEEDWMGCTGACFECAGEAVVWLRGDDLPGAVHELLHATQKILAHRGIGDNECEAYVCEYLVDRWLTTTSSQSRSRSCACASRRTASSQSGPSRRSAKPSRPSSGPVSNLPWQSPPFMGILAKRALRKHEARTMEDGKAVAE